jgi:[ribosomal protein S18]-alanine N-acetyltransferase
VTDASGRRLDLGHGLLPMAAVDAAAVASWRYPPPYDVYDAAGEAVGDAGPAYPPPDERGFGYYVVRDRAGAVAAFVCFGPEGRVPGQTGDDTTLDIGMGVRPDLLSSGLGSTLVPLVLEEAVRRFAPLRVRTAVAAFNERSLRLCARAGLLERRRFSGPRDQPFVELVADVARRPDAESS